MENRTSDQRVLAVIKQFIQVIKEIFNFCVLYFKERKEPKQKLYTNRLFTFDLIADPGFNSINYG